MIDSIEVCQQRSLLRRWREWATFAVVGFALVAVVPAFAADDEDDGTADMTVEQRMIHKLMSGIGATNGTGNNGIEYRERSPLVVPPSTNLPPPDQANAAVAPNWPKDPDVKRRKEAAIERRKARTNTNDRSSTENLGPLSAAELQKGRSSSPSTFDPKPGVNPDDQRISADQLGYKGGIFGTLWNYTKKDEPVPFTGEPTRESLTQPPVGYQTPSSSYAYGAGKDLTPAPKQDDDIKPLSPGKY